MARHESKVEDAVTQQIARLQAEVNSQQSQLTTRPTVTKDLSLVGLIPKWSGSEKAAPLTEFFEAIEGTARIGNWSDADKIQVAVLKLTDAAKAYYSSAQELHSSEVTWQQFKAALRSRFKYVRSDQFHFLQLQTARQRRDETPQEFADRCRSLAQKTLVMVEDPALQRFRFEQAERLPLASFTAGLLGQAGKQVPYARPSTMAEALQIATAVEQAELQEKRNEAFYLEAGKPSSSNSDRTRERDSRKSSEGMNSEPAELAIPQGRPNRSGAKNVRTGNTYKCYECGGVGHFTRECPSRRNRQRMHTNPAMRKVRSQQAESPQKDRTPNGRKTGRKSGNK
jgi:hypothetical protein